MACPGHAASFPVHHPVTTGVTAVREPSTLHFLVSATVSLGLITVSFLHLAFSVVSHGQPQLCQLFQFPLIHLDLYQVSSPGKISPGCFGRSRLAWSPCHLGSPFTSLCVQSPHSWIWYLPLCLFGWSLSSSCFPRMAHGR